MDDPCVDVPPLVKSPDQAELNQQRTVYLSIEGMNCGNCANRVRNALISTYGVLTVTIDQPQGLSEVRFNPALTDPAFLVDAVAAAGNDGFHHYEARVLSPPE